jgi:hypothetical protein
MIVRLACMQLACGDLETTVKQSNLTENKDWKDER